MSDRPRVSIHLIVRNGEKYIAQCVEAIKKQTYPNITFRLFDNVSEDGTVDIARNLFPKTEVIRFEKNFGLGGGFNRSLYYTEDTYVVGLSVDVQIAPDFIETAVAAMENRPNAGVLQAKVYRYDYERDEYTDVIDTTGMQIFKSRRVVNRGHGERDTGQYNKAGEIFCYEGAVPFFRREALEAVKMKKFRPQYAPYVSRNDTARYPYEYLDEDFVWYADEVDLGWRMRLAGWGSWYEPGVVAWHDRQTTHALAKGYRGFIKLRKTIPAFKRKLDFRNLHLSFIKNDFWGTMALHMPWIVKREIMMFSYILLWERTSLKAYTEIITMLPKMLKKRRIIQKDLTRMKKARMKRWFH